MGADASSGESAEATESGERGGAFESEGEFDETEVQVVIAQAGIGIEPKGLQAESEIVEPFPY
jgi:phosphosulfolactate synthase (CoM biosynthesis protein A)